MACLSSASALFPVASPLPDPTSQRRKISRVSFVAQRQNARPALVARCSADATRASVSSMGPRLALSAAVAAGLLLSVEPLPSPSYAAVLQSETSQASQVMLLADDSLAELTPQDRAKQLMEEYKRRKGEEAAAKAAAAAEAAAAAAAAKVEASKAAPAAVSSQEEAKQEAPRAERSAPTAPKAAVQKSSSKRGGMPLFVSQFGVLAAYSGVIAAVVLIPDSQWKAAEKQAEVVGETLAPMIEDAWLKAEPLVLKAKEQGLEVIEKAKPYAVQAAAAAVPAATKAYETAKPVVQELVTKAVEAAKASLNKEEKKSA